MRKGFLRGPRVVDGTDVAILSPDVWRRRLESLSPTLTFPLGRRRGAATVRARRRVPGPNRGD